MNYKIEELEDQLIQALKASSSLSGVEIATHAGNITEVMFLDPTKMEGLVRRLPFILIQYQGKVRVETTSDETGVVHRPVFRLFVGAQSLRLAKESQRSAYAMLRSIYDALNAKFFDYTGSPYSGCSLSSVTPITTDMCQLGPIREVDGRVEQLVVNLPQIVVYMVEYSFKVQA